jgi:hypothetical protein
MRTTSTEFKSSMPHLDGLTWRQSELLLGNRRRQRNKSMNDEFEIVNHEISKTKVNASIGFAAMARA